MQQCFSQATFDYGIPTATSQEQQSVERSINLKFKTSDSKELLHEEHLGFLLRGLKHLSSGYQCLDASRPWLCYWILHSIDVLGELSRISSDQRRYIADFLSKCWDDKRGGFGGGPGQDAHLATSYAAVNALTILGPEYADSVIDRQKLMQFLQLVHRLDGSFVMHEGGETDVRGAYCALSCATLMNVVTPDLVKNTAEYLKSCQTYEGGFTSEPGGEAHGGYTFCGTAALALINKVSIIDSENLLKYAARRQMSFEGGFHGRTNKLVDGCYSFWQAATVHLLQDQCCFDASALQKYILLCCQNPKGGLLDKPGKAPDFYHTCYCLSGLSLTGYNSLNKLDVRFNLTQQTAENMICRYVQS